MINKTKKMANENIIVKFQVEGADKFNKDIEKSADVLLDMAKANKIAEQNSDELAKVIGQTSNELQKLVKEGKSSTDEFKKLSGTLKEQIDIYEKTKQEIDGMVKVTAKYVTLLDNIASGHTNVSKAVKQVKEDIQRLTLVGKENTFEFNVAIETFKMLEKASKDSKKALAEVGGNSEAINSFISKLQTTTSVIGLVQGAVGLFGKENELLNQTLVKVNSLMLIGQSLQQIKVALNEKDAITTGVATIAQRGYALAVGSSTGAMKIFRLALVSTGIGAFVVLLGVAVTAFMKWSESSRQASKNLKLLADVSKEANKNIEDERAELTKLVAIAKNENLSKEQRKNAIKQINENYPEMLGNITLENIGTEKANELLGKQIQILVDREKIKLLSSKIAQAQIDLEIAKTGELLTTWEKVKIKMKQILSGIFGDGDRGKDIENEAIKEKTREIENTITSLTTELNKTLANLGNNVNEKTATNVKTATSKVATETKAVVEVAKSELEIYKNELSALEKELEELQFKRVRMPISKKEEDRIKDLTADIQIMKDVLNSLTVQPSQPIGFIQQLENSLTKTKEELEKLFNETISSGGAIDFDDTNVVELQDKIKSLTSDLEFAKETFNQLMNGDTTTDDSSEGGGSGDVIDKKAERLKELTANMNSFAEKYQVIQSGISQATGLASELFARHTQKETQALDDKLKRGVISQKQYDKEIAKLKNEQARKEKRARTAEAFAMIPMAILSTFTNTTGGLIIKSIAAGIAGAFALATAIMVATAPLPKYRHGGQVFKGNGFVKGRSHSEGGVNAELEGNEFVMKREAVAMYGVNNFNKLNNGLLRPDIFSPNVSNYTNQLERIDYTKEFKKMNEKLEFIYQSTEDGNNIAMQVGKKLIAKENKDARRYN